MKPNRFGQLASLALLVSLASAVAQTPQPAASTAKTAAAPVTGVSSTPPAPVMTRPKGLQGQPVAVTAAPVAPPKKPGAEGVTMHGHWMIDVRNPDGTIAEHRDFENSLLTPADLLYIVTGQYVAGDLGITIASTGSTVCSAIAASSGSLGSCLVATSSTAGLGGFTCSGVAAGSCNYTLKEVTNGGGGNGAITLSGTMPVLASGAVTEVGTELFACSSGGTGTFSTIDPVGCYNGTEGGVYFYGILTGTTITTLNVTAGQTLLFTVVLTFS